MDHENRKIALFLGAGASAAFGKPVTKKIKDDLIAVYRDRAQGNLGIPEGVLYSFLVNKEFQDIEDVYQSLGEWVSFEKSQKYAQMFMKGHQMTMRLVLDNREVHFEIQHLIQRAKSAKELLEDEIFDAYRWDYGQDDTLEKLYDPIISLISEFSSREIHIFTTNYDRAIETFCINKKNQYQCIDGFSYDAEVGLTVWRNGQYEEIATAIPRNKNRVFLYKIHGSLDWKHHKKQGVVRTGVESKSDDQNFDGNIVIYPSVSPKEDAEQEPYATILKKMSNFAKIAEAFVVIGYSFRDHNINQVFRALVDEGKSIIIISRSGKEQFKKGVIDVDKLPEEKRQKIHFIGKRLEHDTIEDIVKDLTMFLSNVSRPPQFTLETFVENGVRKIRLLHPDRSLENCMILFNGLPLIWDGTNSPSKTIGTGGGGNAVVPHEIFNEFGEVAVTASDVIISRMKYKDIKQIKP